MGLLGFPTPADIQKHKTEFLKLTAFENNRMLLKSFIAPNGSPAYADGKDWKVLPQPPLQEPQDDLRLNNGVIAVSSYCESRCSCRVPI
jgi:hypothetical protein